MSTQVVPISDEYMECPLCRGEGRLMRTEVLDRLGAKDLNRVAQLSAEQALRLLLATRKSEENSLWLRFESEVSKRTTVIEDRNRQLQASLDLAGERQSLEIEKATTELTNTLNA
jgi:hypothetical protein